MKRVIVTQRVDRIRKYHENRDSLDQNLLKWLIKAGFLPFPITNKLVDLNDIQKDQLKINKWISTVNPNAILLAGGNNIGEYPERDETEKFLLDWAFLNKIPVLGICRGMQMLVVWGGGKLNVVMNHVKVRHKLIINDVKENWPNDVNSYHDLGVISCPSEFKIIAKTHDNVIEAIKHKNLPWEGWMWHPEREVKFNNVDLNRIKSLFNIN